MWFKWDFMWQTMQMEERQRKNPPINKHVSICGALPFFMFSTSIFFTLRRGCVCVRWYFSFYFNESELFRFETAKREKCNDSVFNTFQIGVQLHLIHTLIRCFFVRTSRIEEDVKNNKKWNPMKIYKKNWNASMADQWNFFSIQTAVLILDE